LVIFTPAFFILVACLLQKNSEITKSQKKQGERTIRDYRVYTPRYFLLPAELIHTSKVIIVAPAGAIVKFKDDSFWPRHKKGVVTFTVATPGKFSV